MKIAISSGHGKYIAGASGYLVEVPEARRQVDQIADYLQQMGVEVWTFHDDTSHDVSTNLRTITNWHNSRPAHDLDISCHFNAGGGTGCEVLYITQEELAREVSAAIAHAAGWKDRGAKYRNDLYVLSNTNAPCILTETCFVDSQSDADKWNAKWEEICAAIAETVSGQEAEPLPEPSTPEILFETDGKCSWFGSPADTIGVSADEGLAFIFEYDPDTYPHHRLLFLPEQPAGTTGLARRLNGACPYVACRWDYNITSKEMLRQPYPALVRAPSTDREFLAWPADWGPHEEKTGGRVADLSPGLMEKLGLETDDIVDVIYPAAPR
jgi:N-acetylmuramoyl-L-alanine amidase